MQVTKCRSCGEILSEKDFRKSEEELRLEAKAAENAKPASFVLGFILAIFGLLFLVALLPSMKP